MGSASVALVFAGGSLSDAFARVRQHILSEAWEKPPSLRGYAYINLVGVLLLAAAFLVLAILSQPATWELACFVALGAFVVGIASPLAAFWALAALISFCRAMRRATLPLDHGHDAGSAPGTPAGLDDG